MQARLIAYPPEGAATICLVRANGVLRIGRVSAGAPASDPPDNDHLLLGHASVSRAHAELRGEGGGWRLLDLNSKNGSFIDGIRAHDASLPSACWLRFGDVHCEFAAIDDVEVANRVQGITERRNIATAHTAKLQRLTGLGDLLDASLRAVLELAHCERGFVLLENERGFTVRTSRAMEPTRLEAREFSGSIGAVRRTLTERRAIVANDIGRLGWLAGRASVATAGLDALVCLPLLDGAHVLGAIYADRVRPGPAISTLDLELLEAFAENAAVWIAAQRARELLDAHSAPSGPAGMTSWEDIIAAQSEDIR